MQRFTKRLEFHSILILRCLHVSHCSFLFCFTRFSTKFVGELNETQTADENSFRIVILLSSAIVQLTQITNLAKSSGCFQEPLPVISIVNPVKVIIPSRDKLALSYPMRNYRIRLVLMRVLVATCSYLSHPGFLKIF